MFYVYVLSSLQQKYLYVGLTNSLERRLNSTKLENHDQHGVDGPSS